MSGVIAAIGLGLSAVGSGVSFAQAAKARREQRKAQLCRGLLYRDSAPKSLRSGATQIYVRLQLTTVKRVIGCV